VDGGLGVGTFILVNVQTVSLDQLASVERVDFY